LTDLTSCPGRKKRKETKKKEKRTILANRIELFQKRDVHLFLPVPPVRVKNERKKNGEQERRKVRSNCRFMDGYFDEIRKNKKQPMVTASKRGCPW
jgi:hypothetical protein